MNKIKKYHINSERITNLDEIKLLLKALDLSITVDENIINDMSKKNIKKLKNRGIFIKSKDNNIDFF